MAEDDDDFEDLFSFGASTPVMIPPLSSSSKVTNLTNSTEFDLLSDVSPSSTRTPGAGGGACTVVSSPAPSAAGDDVAAIPAISKPFSLEEGESATTEGDEFDSLFGTPPIAPAAPPTPLGSTTAQKDLLLKIDKVRPNECTSKKHPQHCIDDFHVHDEDTRDMLEWLDDDKPGTKSHDSTKQVEDDDFDFDQMIAEAGNVEALDEINMSAGANEGSQKVCKKIPLPDKRKQNSPKGKPQVLASAVSTQSNVPDAPVDVSEELDFDQWVDDEIEEVGDLLLTADNAKENARGKSTGIHKGNACKRFASPDQNNGVAAIESRKPSPTEKIAFTSLSDAVRSNLSTSDDVLSLYAKERHLYNGDGEGVGINEVDRAHLWTKVICNKILGDIDDGSLADSYRDWEKKGEAATMFEGESHSAMIDSCLTQACGEFMDDETYKATKRQLISLSYYHSLNNRKPAKSCSSPEDSVDPLIPPVALAILQAKIPPGAASVVLSQLEPSSMPLLRLSDDGERYLAAQALHADFYLLACYHLPLLVIHLDRHCPGWYWPRRRRGENGNGMDEEPVNDDEKDGAVANNDEKQGEEGSDKSKDNKVDSQHLDAKTTPDKKKKCDFERNGLVPLSWFVTNFAGECSHGSESSSSCLDHKTLLPLLDNILTKGDHSWKYFLGIAILEKNSDALLMSRGDELKSGLERILDFQESSFAEDSFVGADEHKADATSEEDMVSGWLTSAKSLMESTPSSVIELLRSSDDRAVASALKVRQAKVDEELQAQLNADEAAQNKEREERDKEAEWALNRARLTAYYRIHNPEKVDKTDQILKLFDGRMGVLNEKLKNKYGKGFLPEEALKGQTLSFLMSVNQSITETRKHVSVVVSERRKKMLAKSSPEVRSHKPVVLEVSTTEVIPVICTTKSYNIATRRKMYPVPRTSDTDASLQFYLVDCRPDSIASEQGRFPTAVSLSPEKLQDPSELEKLTDMFESLRSAVHICVMGEGFASFPVLYNHSLSKAEEKLLEDDVARTSNCALFFLKKGFPFVSVLLGGFAAAHAFLSRNGPAMGMAPPDVLVDYDPSVSLFAELETARQEEDQYKNASTREKTARTLQKIIDKSMTRLTIEERRINALANDLAKPETMDKMTQSAGNFLAKARPRTVPSISFGRTPPLFMTKRFASSSTKEAKEYDKKAENSQKDDKAKTSATRFTDKVNLQLPLLHSQLSSTALPNKDKDVIEKENHTTSYPDVDSVSTDVFSDEGNVGSCTSDCPSKVSTAFAPLTQQIQQPRTSSVMIAPVSVSEETILEGNVKTNARVGSKISFSSFTNRLMQVPETKVSRTKEDKDNNGGRDTSDGPSTVSSTFALFTQRIQKSTTTVTLPTAGDGQPTFDGDRSKEEDISGRKKSFSDFANRIKFVQQSADRLPKPPSEITEAKILKSVSDKNEGGTADAPATIPSDNWGEDSKPCASTDTSTDGGRFTKFTKSIGGTFSGLRDKASQAKVLDENNESTLPGAQKEKEEITTSTGKSIGASLSELQNQPVRQNRFSSFLQSKLESNDPKQSAVEEETDPVSKTISSLALTSIGKLFLKDEPLPKTRFQRLEAEESILFEGKIDGGVAGFTAIPQGALDDLFPGLDPRTHDHPAKLSDVDMHEEKLVNTTMDGNDQKLAFALTHRDKEQPASTPVVEDGKPANTLSALGNEGNSVKTP